MIVLWISRDRWYKGRGHAVRLFACKPKKEMYGAGCIMWTAPGAHIMLSMRKSYGLKPGEVRKVVLQWR